jgi:WD40 repeat protein
VAKFFIDLIAFTAPAKVSILHIAMSITHYNAFISYSHSDCGSIAPHVQKAIENIGKPWYWIGRKRLNVFRDETNLSANPSLWDFIAAALRNADYFILLASPRASESKWILKEVEWWLKNKNINTLLIAVVKGNIHWIQQGDVNDFDWEKTDCLPHSLKKKFTEEPLYVDIRPYYSADDQRLIEGPGFRSQMVKIISAIIGRPPREIDSDELRRQNNIKKFLIGVGLLLGCLVIALFFLFSDLQKSNIKTQNQLARSYWDKDHQAANNHNYSAALLYAAEAVGLSKDENLTKYLLTEIEAYLPAMALKDIYPHEDTVSCAVFSPDGKKIITASGNQAFLWDVVTGKQIGPSLQHDIFNRSIKSAVFSPNGKWVLTADDNEKVRIWDVATGKPVGPYLEHENSVAGAVFSPDGQYILTTTRLIPIYGYNRSPILRPQLWEIATGKRIASAFQQEDSVLSAIFSPDGKWILTTSKRYTAKLWDTKTGRQIGPPMLHLNLHKHDIFYEGVITSAVFSADGKRILTIRNSTGLFWEAGTGKPIKPYLEGIRDALTPVFSADGNSLLTASYSGLQLLDVATGQPIVSKMEEYGSYTIYNAAFSADGKWIVTANGNKISLWNAINGTPIGKPALHESGIKGVVFSPDGKYILTAGIDKTARLWEVRKDAQAITVMRHRKIVLSAVFSSDGKRILTTSGDSTARQWEVANGKQFGPPLGHQGAVKSAVFSPNGRYILTTGEDKTARLWDAGTGRQIGSSIQYITQRKYLSMPRHDTSRISIAVFSQDSRYFITVEESIMDGKVWEVKNNGYEYSAEARNTSDIKGLVFSPNGKLILTISNDKTARILEFPTFDDNHCYLEHDDWVNSAKFSADGQRILTLSGNKVRLWDVNTCKQIGATFDLIGFDDCADLSPDGRQILTVNRVFKTASLWDAVTGQEVVISINHNDEINSAVFSPDGRWIATASKDNTARVWPLGGDLDIPSDLLKIQAETITGLELSLTANEIKFIPKRQWYRLKDEYYTKARQHFRECKYPEYNLWRRLHP